MTHRLEGGIFGQVVAHVVGEHLVDHRGGHDRRDQHAEGEQLAGRRLADPVVRLACGGSRPANRARRPAAGCPARRGRRPRRSPGRSRGSLRKPNWTCSVEGRSQSRAKLTSLQMATPSAAKPRSSGNPPTIRTAVRPISQPSKRPTSGQPKSRLDSSSSSTHRGSLEPRAGLIDGPTDRAEERVVPRARRRSPAARGA